MESYGFGKDTVPWDSVKDLVYPVLDVYKRQLLLCSVKRPGNWQMDGIPLQTGQRLSLIHI